MVIRWEEIMVIFLILEKTVRFIVDRIRSVEIQFKE